MSLLPIRTHGDPVLSTPTQEIKNIDGRIAALAQSMLETMYAAPGVGLAANQIGVSQRIFVYDDGNGPGVIINPQIIEKSGEYHFEEGCLSVPGHSWEIMRPDKVHLVGFDLDGNELDIEADQYLGRIFQHETDHLDGFLLIDRLDPPELQQKVKKMLRKQHIEIDSASKESQRNIFGK